MKEIIWLASYPKSGNTWFRAFLANLRSESEEPSKINELRGAPIASSRGTFDDTIGIESSDLTSDEIDRLRPRLYEHLAQDFEETQFMKVHDAFTKNPDGLPLFPDSVTKGAIYLIRNPLDVAVSLAHHSGTDYRKSIEKMGNSEYALCSRPNKLHNQLRQRLLSWSEHVQSWIDEPAFPVCVIRYEDLKLRPLETFENAIAFAGLDYNQAKIPQSVERSRFEELQRQEDRDGFRERSPRSERFFRKGEVGSWREELDADLAVDLIRTHREVMVRFGYLDDQANPIF